VRREVFEEAAFRSALSATLPANLGPFPHRLCSLRPREADQQRDHNRPKREIEAAMWVTKEEMMMSSPEHGHPTIKPARKGRLPIFLYKNGLRITATKATFG